MQLIMPQEALRYDFLLNGIFVAAALHRSTTAPESEARGYFNVAMELCKWHLVQLIPSLRRSDEKHQRTPRRPSITLARVPETNFDGLR